jgi:hypothetical protein
VDEDLTPDNATEAGAGIATAPDQSSAGGADGHVTPDEGSSIDRDAGFGHTPIDAEVADVPVATAAVVGTAWPSHDDEDTPHEDDRPAESRAESEAGSSDDESMEGHDDMVDDSAVVTDLHASGNEDDGGDQDDPEGATIPPVVTAPEPDSQPAHDPAAPPQSIAGAFGAARFGVPRPIRPESGSGEPSLQQPDEDPPGTATHEGEPGRGVAP